MIRFVNATEIKNSFGKYLEFALQGDEVIIMKNGKEVAKLISKDKTISFLSDSLVGILKGKPMDAKEIRAERLSKYENIDWYKRLNWRVKW